MRLANVEGLAAVVAAERAEQVDVIGVALPGTPELAIEEAFERWDEVVEWSRSVDRAAAVGVDRALLGPPSPRPAQVFAIGLNYAAHAVESGHPIPSHPATFTKFPTCLVGPCATVGLPSDSVDYEIELVVVISHRAYQVRLESAWSYVAGLSIGQDLSERAVQLRPPAPQFSLGKSFPGFGPVGPWITTPQHLSTCGLNRDDLTLTARLNGEVVQDSRTSDLIFPVAAIIEYVSHITPMLPGDVIFTGTPAGVGMGRTPPRYLRPGDVLESTIEGLGTMITRFVRRPDPHTSDVEPV